ncbi:hypothetical protein, partial [Leptospira wolffii]
MRNDFSQTIKKKLSDRAGNKCSNPECRRATVGPASENDKIINIGVASHITAASPGGPRFDKTLTELERSSYKNGIWLCQNCAKIIDSDLDKHTVELIQSWKQGAEDEASEYVNGRLSNVNALKKDIIEFSLIRLDSSLKGWKETDELIDNYPKIYPEFHQVFRRYEFADIDPIFDISLINNIDNGITISSIGVIIDCTISHIAGFGESEAYELDIKASYSVDIGSVDDKIYTLLEDQKNHPEKYQGRLIKILDHENLPDEYRGSIQRIASNLNIKFSTSLQKPMYINGNSAVRITLQLKNYNIWHEGILHLFIKTNKGYYYSKP